MKVFYPNPPSSISIDHTRGSHVSHTADHHDHHQSASQVDRLLPSTTFHRIPTKEYNMLPLITLISTYTTYKVCKTFLDEE